MKTLILAGGLNTRLKPIIGATPKVLALVAGKPFISFMLSHLRASGLTDMVMAVGYQSEAIMRYLGDGRKFGVNISYSNESQALGTAGCVRHAHKLLGNEDFLVVNGDVYFDIDLKRFNAFHRKHRGCATLALSYMSHKGTTIPKLDRAGKVIDYLDNPDGKLAGFANAGVYLFSPEIFRHIPQDTKMSLEWEVFPRLVTEGLLYGWKGDGHFLEIGTPERYKQAQKARFLRRI